MFNGESLQLTTLKMPNKMHYKFEAGLLSFVKCKHHVTLESQTTIESLYK